MRYAQIRKMDISNGIGIGVALFVQGCPFHCNGCFNPETWDFNKGQPWTQEVEEQFFKLIDKPHITRVSILGGEPLTYPEGGNRRIVHHLLYEIKKRYPHINTWVYTGYTFEEIHDDIELLHNIDVLVDGRFVLGERDLNLKFKGSANQRVIDVQKTLKEGKVVELEL